jgi:hypothetical protein
MYVYKPRKRVRKSISSFREFNDHVISGELRVVRQTPSQRCTPTGILYDRGARRRDARPHVSAFLSDGTSDGRAWAKETKPRVRSQTTQEAIRKPDKRTLQFTLWVHNHTSIVLKVDEHAIWAAPRLALTHDHGRRDC